MSRTRIRTMKLLGPIKRPTWSVMVDHRRQLNFSQGDPQTRTADQKGRRNVWSELADVYTELVSLTIDGRNLRPENRSASHEAVRTSARGK